MAVTLDASLLAKQTAQSRRPVIQLTAGKLTSQYPLNGTPIANVISKDQGVVDSLFLSDGSLVALYAGEGSGNPKAALWHTVTDAGLTEFSDHVKVSELNSFDAVDQIDAIVIDANDNLGVATCSGEEDLYLLTVNKTGSLLNTSTKLNINTLTGATVVQTGTGYALIYFREQSGTYKAYLSTSTDFDTWTAGVEITIPGLTSTYRIEKPDLIKLENGNYLLVFSYANITSASASVKNIYYSISSDLTTWSTVTAVTSSTDVAQDYTAPVIDQFSTNGLMLAVEKQQGYLQMTASTDGWDSTLYLNPHSCWVDETNRKLYIGSYYTAAGTKKFNGACKIDLDTWSIDAFYDYGTTPGLCDIFKESNCVYEQRNTIQDGYVAVATQGYFAKFAAAVIDFNTDTIKQYFFRDSSSTYGVEAEANVTADIDLSDTYYYLGGCFIDDGKLWLGFENNRYNSTTRAVFGYIDLSQSTAPYTFNQVCEVETDTGETVIDEGIGSFVHFDTDHAVVCSEFDAYENPAALYLYDYTGSLIKKYRSDTHPNYPLAGVLEVTVDDSAQPVIYAVPDWQADQAADLDKWGLMVIDTNNDQISYKYPPWETTAGVHVYSVRYFASANEVVMRIDDGIAIFNTVTEQWTRLASSENPDLPAVDNESFFNGGIGYYAGEDSFIYGDLKNLYLVPRDGLATSLKYSTADTQTAPSFSAPSSLVTAYNSSAPAVAIDSNDDPWFFWNDQNGTLESVYFAGAESSTDLGEYLVDEVAVSHTLDGVSTLKFNLSHGHLFDPFNSNSLLRSAVAKGKAVTLKLGETISGSDVFSEQGTWIIRSHRVRHKRGDYPVIEISCEDPRSHWSSHVLTAVSLSEDTPEQALQAVITGNTSLTTDDIVIPSFDGSFSFDAQWVDTYLQDIVEDIAHRFQYFPRMNNEGKITFSKITKTATPSRTIGKSEIVEFAPDDTFTDLTNRITVSGESLTDFEKVYGEERLQSINGTVGWYGHKGDVTVYYSDDKELRCHNPRLQIGESASSILFQLAGKIKESITDVDEFDRYCVVTIEAPNLTPFLVAGIAMYVAGNAIGDLVVSTFGGFTVPVGRYIEGIGLYLCLMTLASVGNYQYEIYGQPIGYVKHSYSASADDEDLQNELGFIVENKFEGFLTHTPQYCQDVADFELMVSQLQRKRATITKTAHLQDELGDTVTATHPYTGEGLPVFITSLTRRYKQGKDGYFLDEIEGWVL